MSHHYFYLISDKIAILLSDELVYKILASNKTTLVINFITRVVLFDVSNRIEPAHLLIKDYKSSS